MSLIYEISSKFDDLPRSTREWRQCEKGKYSCKTCQKLNRNGIYPKPVDVAIDEKPASEPIVIGVFFSFGDLYHINFIDQIRSYMTQFVFGKCYLPDGSLVKNYVTCYSKNTIVIRGKKGARYYQCNECKSVTGPLNPPHYTLHMYLDGSGVYQDAIQTLYLDEWLVDEIDFSPWPDMILEPIEVKDEFVDQRRLICDPQNPSWDYIEESE